MIESKAVYDRKYNGVKTDGTHSLPSTDNLAGYDVATPIEFLAVHVYIDSYCFSIFRKISDPFL